MPTQQVYSLHKTGSDTYRILINGQVNPLLVGFLTPKAALTKLKDKFNVNTSLVVIPDELKQDFKSV